MGTCPKCGAEWIDGRDCDTIFSEFLNLEFTDAGYGAVHFLTVACTMIQHDRTSDEALTWITGMLRTYFEQNLTDQQLRAFAQRSVQQQNRTWKVGRAADAPPLPRIVWQKTIADVDRNQHDAASYREQVKEWARLTLEQMDTAR